MAKSKTPLPGRPLRSSRTGRPIMAVLDLLGRRWSLRVLWELRDSALPFRTLQARCGGLSPSVLNTRLRELREAKIVELVEEGYRLTSLGRTLFGALLPLSDWADAWARAVK